MIIVAFIGIIGAAITGNASLDIPAFTGFTAANGNGLLEKMATFKQAQRKVIENSIKN